MFKNFENLDDDQEEQIDIESQEDEIKHNLLLYQSVYRDRQPRCFFPYPEVC